MTFGPIGDFEPLLDHIVVERAEQGGAIALPYQQEGGPTLGTVVAVGPGRPSEYTGEIINYGAGARRSSPVRDGDTIIYHGGAGTPVTHDGKDYRYIFPRDVIAVLP